VVFSWSASDTGHRDVMYVTTPRIPPKRRGFIPLAALRLLLAVGRVPAGGNRLAL
jgi:hypothetical protein